MKKKKWPLLFLQYRREAVTSNYSVHTDARFSPSLISFLFLSYFPFFFWYNTHADIQSRERVLKTCSERNIHIHKYEQQLLLVSGIYFYSD